MESSPACESCLYWRRDSGIFAVFNWDPRAGFCLYEPREIEKNSDGFCHYYSRSEKQDN